MKILNQEVINCTSSEHWLFAILSFVLFVVIYYNNIGFTFAAAAGLLGTAVFLLLQTPNGYYYNQYKAIINETYPAKDLYEKYDIMEQRGDICVIRDKEKKYDNAE